MTDESGQYQWPDESATSQAESGPMRTVNLIVLYGAPFLTLLLFPNLAWVALLPGGAILGRTSPAKHRRRLVWIYLITGLISLAPWIALLLR